MKYTIFWGEPISCRLEYQSEAAEAAAEDLMSSNFLPPPNISWKKGHQKSYKSYLKIVGKNLQYSEAKRGSAAGLEYQPEAAEAAADDLMSW